MLNLNTQTPQQSLSAELVRFRPLQPDFERFKSALKNLLTRIDEAEREKNQENHIRDFLLNAFYVERNEINSKNDIDLVVHNSKTNVDTVGVIIETKSPSNKSEMLTAEKPNSKALRQAILYFLEERVVEKNTDLKFIVITNINEWFVFRALDFNRLFFENRKFVKDFEDWRDGKKVNRTKPFFYDEIAKPFLDAVDETIGCAVFDLRKVDFDNEADLIALYKIFSPYHLLKESLANDSNALDRNFYVELLHVVGLEETKIKNKVLITRKPAAMRDNGSLLEKAIAKIESKFSRFDAKRLADFGADEGEQVFNIALELVLVWTNRVLFLKLLESQLVGYHENKSDYRFLNTATINNFGELFVLFHEVLNKTSDARNARNAAKYGRVPYLNSSLFEFANVENFTLTVDELDENAPLKLIRDSILHKTGGGENLRELPTLEYLFRFLDAYDFASEGDGDDVQRENRSLINASVLGKVFEKINGYKDGSFYTPGFITMYMCRQAIRAAVVQKFRDETEFDADDFEDLKSWTNKFYKRDDIKRLNAVINTLKLCDPAVGSGHFLVSALNEILSVKSELGVFADANGTPFGNYRIAVANDEIVVTTRENKPFRYKIGAGGEPVDDEMQRLQETLFHEKQLLIENCLFGVDINANSVKICRLRLWIELLKNAYYKPANGFRDLETLPNIDINIKLGNSLVSRFKLQDKFRSPQINRWIKDYGAFVAEYKNVKERTRKDELKMYINNFHKAFSGLLEKETTNLEKQLAKKIATLAENQNPLFTERNDAEKDSATRRLKAEIEKLEGQIAEIESKYANAFEWRFEFPEVLSADGDFKGFDIVIGNPPYIRQEELGKLKLHLKSRYEVFAGTADLLVYFYEIGLNVLKPSGNFSFITSNKFMRSNFGKALRNYLWKYNISDIVDFGELPVFPEAATFPVVINLSKTDNRKLVKFTQVKSLDFELLQTVLDEFSIVLDKTSFADNDWILFDDVSVKLIEKLKSNGTQLVKYINGEINYGIKTGLNKAFVIDESKRAELLNADNKSAEIIFPFVVGDDVRNYSLKNNKPKFIILTKIGTEIEKYPAIFEHLKSYQRDLEIRYDKGKFWYELRACSFYEDFAKPKIIFPEIAKEPRFTLDERGFFVNNKTLMIPRKDLFLLGYLNSKTAWFIFKKICSVLGDAENKGRLELKLITVKTLPIPKASDEQKQFIETLVNRIIEAKQTGVATSALESEIDAMVYKLYDLTVDEIAIVGGSLRV